MGAFIDVLLEYMDPIAAILAVGFTQLIRFLLPTPKDSTSKFDVHHKIYRFLPILPLFLAVILVYVRGVLLADKPMEIEDAISKGLVSGFAAAYFHRATKIFLFGKAGYENGKNNRTDHYGSYYGRSYGSGRYRDEYDEDSGYSDKDNKDGRGGI